MVNKILKSMSFLLDTLHNCCAITKSMSSGCLFENIHIVHLNIRNHMNIAPTGFPQKYLILLKLLLLKQVLDNNIGFYQLMDGLH